MIILALLGFTGITESVPLNDKILHFIRLGLASGVFYFIFDVDEDARRVWFWRYSGLIATGFICFFIGGIVSEIVQSLLPSKTFDFGDVVANLLGSSLGLYISFHLECYYRRRREIARLYKPLYDEGGFISDEEDEGLLPTSAAYPGTPAGQSAGKVPRAASPVSGGHPPPLHFKNVWDDRLDAFDIGDDEDDEESAPSSSRPNGKPSKV